jgi:hypothetical protein
MQQAIRWRRRRPAPWQVAVARWLLAVAVIISLSPSTSSQVSVVRAQDDQITGRMIADDDTHPEHATTDDGAPVVLPPVRPPVSRPLFEPGGIHAAGAQRLPDQAPTQPARATDDEGPVRSEQLPDDDLPSRSERAHRDEVPAHTDVMPGGSAAIYAEEMPEDEPMPSTTQPAPAVGNRRVYNPQNRPASSCPAELGYAKGASFGRDDRLVMTYYYYWYDEASLEDPALSQHPPTNPPLDWRSVAWHERQLADMASAGVDVALAVYWGDTAAWSMDGLAPMVEARENLLAAGLRPPAIGLFFDTNMYAMILPERPELNDLTTDDGLSMLADQIGIFLDYVPPCHLARVDGRPLAFFWRADTEDGDQFKFDDSTFDNITDMIAARYDERLHLVVEQSWVEAARKANVELGAVDVYRWGAALNGTRFYGRTVAVGPGYDDTRIGGRPGYTRERTDGGTYSRDLRQAVMSGTPWLLLETWNELWEGTAIAETEETGRTYLGITARYTALFHQLGKERARDAWFDLGTSRNAYLRRLADAPIEQGAPAEENGRWGARPFKEDADGTGYFHFALDRRLGLNGAQTLTVYVEYFDEGEGSFVLEYDSLDPDAPEGGVYKPTDPVYFENTRTWRTHRFLLDDASLKHRQYDDGGDFRLHDRPGPDERLHAFGRVTTTVEPAARPVPFEPESLSFVDPGPRETVTLRWSEAGTSAGYLVVVQPFDVEDDTDLHGFTTDDRRRCIGEAPVEPGQETRGLTRQATCELRLSRDLEEGIYRWRVQALDAGGTGIGQASDWGFFVVARR